MQNLSKLFLCQLASLFKEVASPTHFQLISSCREWSLELPPRAPSCTASAPCPSPASVLAFFLPCSSFSPLSSVSLCGQGRGMVMSRDVLVSWF